MEINVALTKQFNKEEVDTALKQVPMKSLGPDGFNTCFYQTYWNIVGEEVTSVVLKFLNESIFDNCISFTYIFLIQKMNDLLKLLILDS